MIFIDDSETKSDLIFELILMPFILLAMLFLLIISVPVVLVDYVLKLGKVKK